MRALLVATAVLAAVPAVAGAQNATEARRQQAYENLRQLEQSQRVGEVERQLGNMEIRRQSDEALRALQARPIPVVVPPYVAPTNTATIVPRSQQAYENIRQLEQNQRVGEVERQLSNMEIRRQSDEALQALQTPRLRAADQPYVVAGSSAATGVPAIRQRPPSTVIETRYAADGYTAPSGRVSAEDVARDAELAATNARLREIALAQRGG